MGVTDHDPLAEALHHLEDMERPFTPDHPIAMHNSQAAGLRNALAVAGYEVRPKLTAERLAAALCERKAVFGISGRYGVFNDAYYEREAALILAALDDAP